MYDPAHAPAVPCCLLVIHTGDEGHLALTLDGKRITVGSDLDELREAGRDELRIRAALAGRPLRALRIEPSPSAPFNMIIYPDGTMLDVPERPALPAEPDPLAETSAVPDPAHLPPAPACLPESYRKAWAAVWASRAAGDLTIAVARAHRLETAVTEQLGESHPAAVTVLTARAWLTLCQCTDLRETTQLLITTTLRCHAAQYLPEADVLRTARNAYACWGRLLSLEPQAAIDLAQPLADMLAILDEDERGKLPPRYRLPDPHSSLRAPGEAEPEPEPRILSM
ncbi:hypothetical protein [Streptomyces sp. RKAG293]|uniref:hypothetical protein n=1 Tax=Streptomyces sp. RKAG293 TaxID=2893403 RepID=UPI0020340D7F|nr:hypothetical protein [Streptomyces sp. RKAG293]MCM2422645.1 hypothetical protein [Streptomyces sp. RKAG293]